jgi:surface antigen
VARKAPTDEIYSVLKGLRPMVACVAALALGGCAISTPLGPIFGGDDDTSTGSVMLPDNRFASTMSESDWTFAQGAVRSALDSTPERPPAPWHNPATGSKGTISPVASAFAVDGALCQAFTAVVTTGGQTSFYQGRACRTGSKPWTVTETSAWTPPQGRGPA